MTDTVKLEKAIADSGLKKARIAAELKVTYQTLKRKINNEVPFNAGAIPALRTNKNNEKPAGEVVRGRSCGDCLYIFSAFAGRGFC